MRTIEETIAGNYAFAGSGRYFRILSAESNVDISFFQRGSLKEQALQVGSGFWSRFDEPFDRIDIAGTGLVKFAVSEVEGGWDRVSIDGGVSIAQANIINQTLGVTVAGVPTLILPANSARKRFVFRHNDISSEIMLGFSGVGLSSPIRVGPGETWIETDAAAAEWWIVCASARNYAIQEAY